MTSGPVIADPRGRGRIQRNRAVMGATNPANAAEHAAQGVRRQRPVQRRPRLDSPASRAWFSYFFAQTDVCPYIGSTATGESRGGPARVEGRPARLRLNESRPPSATSGVRSYFGSALLADRAPKARSAAPNAGNAIRVIVLASALGRMPCQRTSVTSCRSFLSAGAGAIGAQTSRGRHTVMGDPLNPLRIGGLLLRGLRPR